MSLTSRLSNISKIGAVSLLALSAGCVPDSLTPNTKQMPASPTPAQTVKPLRSMTQAIPEELGLKYVETTLSDGTVYWGDVDSAGIPEGYGIAIYAQDSPKNEKGWIKEYSGRFHQGKRVGRALIVVRTPGYDQNNPGKPVFKETIESKHYRFEDDKVIYPTE